MNSLLGNIRFYILILSVLLSILLYSLAEDTYTAAQTFGITAVIFLYITILAGPFTKAFINFPLRAQYLKARRAFGVSAFYFGLLHYISTINYQGMEGMIALTTNAPLPAYAGLISLFILLLMALTSFDKVIRIMTFTRWKFLHRLVYLIEILLLLHIFLLGSHFADRSSFYSLVTYIAIAFLVGLQLSGIIKKRLRSTQPTSSTV